MLDSKYLRYELEVVAQKLATRQFSFNKEQFIHLETQRKVLQEEVQTLQHRSNAVAKQLGQLKRAEAQGQAEGNRIDACLKESQAIKLQLTEKMTAFQSVQKALHDFLLTLPNLPHASVPIGKNEKDNLVIREWGKPPVFDFPAKDHVDLMGSGSHTKSTLLDFTNAAKITGSRFVILHGVIAKLQRALIQWMLDVHTEQNDYQEVMVPYLVNTESLQATGQLPSFSEDVFRIKEPDHLYLIPTGEVPLTNLARDKIFEAHELPQKYVAYTSCFRSEAGSYGRDVRGMLRQHQFEKVELVHFVTPDQGEAALESLTHAAESILQQLELPYRVSLLCTGDLGFSAVKTYDLEVWLPGQSAFREISSCSYVGDFQARRLKARWRCPKSKQLTWIHTLNGSGLAVGRTLVAILENYQQPDGSVRIPKVLQPYMHNQKLITENTA